LAVPLAVGKTDVLEDRRLLCHRTAFSRKEEEDRRSGLLYHGVSEQLIFGHLPVSTHFEYYHVVTKDHEGIVQFVGLQIYSFNATVMLPLPFNRATCWHSSM
jgi:hypothetical protein